MVLKARFVSDCFGQRRCYVLYGNYSSTRAGLVSKCLAYCQDPAFGKVMTDSIIIEVERMRNDLTK